MKFLVLTLLMASSLPAFAETLHLGKFSSKDPKEDQSTVRMLGATVMATTNTYGATLPLEGCNKGKVGNVYTPLETNSAIYSILVNETRLDTVDAEKSLNQIKNFLKEKVPNYCGINSEITAVFFVRLAKTNRQVKSVVKIRSTATGLVVETPNGNQGIDQDITLYETL